MNAPVSLGRRWFIRTGLTLAGGLAVGLGTGIRPAQAISASAQPWDKGDSSPYDLDAWIAIEPDDSVLIRYTRAELGQGSMTSLPMMVAEELMCDWSRVRVEYGSPARSLRENNVYGDMSSVGSHSVRDSQLKMRQVGASARVRLVQAAAAKWDVPAAECSAANSVVTHAPSGRTLRYGELAQAAAAIALGAEPVLKTPEQWSLMGTPQKRVDVPFKVDGSAQFAIDTRLPGMVYAAVIGCPVPGGKLASVDTSPLDGAKGIVGIVKMPNALAVVATDTFWRAKQALAKLHPEWAVSETAQTDSKRFAAEYRLAALSSGGAVARNDGEAPVLLDAAKAAVRDPSRVAPAATYLEALYEVPYLAHATMEPMNATVNLKEDRMDVWVGTQSADRTLKAAAALSGLEPQQIFIHNCYVGGGFGRKSNNDDMAQAIAIAKQVKRPVKLIWTREEDIRHDRFRPQAAIAFRGALGADGLPAAWEIRTAVGSLFRSLGINPVANGIEPMAIEGLANNPYKIPATRVECVLKNTHIPVAFWRSVGASQNGFAIESFVDEMALAAKQDSYKFRRALLTGHDDWLKVLDTAAEKGDWGKPLPAGHARGIAIHECYGTVVAEVAEVSMKEPGQVKVEKVTVAVDCGHAVNPLSVAEQMEGAVIYALSAALYGKITVRNGAVEQGNFDSYQMVRMAQAPKIDVHFALTGGSKWGGAGEPGAGPLAAAVCNAIAALTGKRIRSLPIMDHDLTAAS